MKILLIDEDSKHVPHIADEFRQLGNEVEQIYDWREVELKLKSFHPDAVLLDSMMPPTDLPVDECDAGFTTGAYVYRHKLNRSLKGVPFAIFSAAYLGAGVIRQADHELRAYTEYRGLIAKGEDVEEIIKKMS